jgi:hypothetical protein
VAVEVLLKQWVRVQVEQAVAALDNLVPALLE